MTTDFMSDFERRNKAYKGMFERYMAAPEETEREISSIRASLQRMGEPSETMFLSAEETLRQFETEIPEGWQLAVTPPLFDGTPTIRLITPEKWQITDLGTFISPEGTELTEKQILTMPIERLPESLRQMITTVAPEMPEIRAGIPGAPMAGAAARGGYPAPSPEDIMDISQFPAEIQESIVQEFGTIEVTRGQLEEWMLTQRQYLEHLEDSFKTVFPDIDNPLVYLQRLDDENQALNVDFLSEEIRGRLGEVFPTMPITIGEYNNWARMNDLPPAPTPQMMEFYESILEQGRNENTENLLKTLGANETEIEEFFLPLEWRALSEFRKATRIFTEAEGGHKVLAALGVAHQVWDKYVNRPWLSILLTARANSGQLDWQKIDLLVNAQEKYGWGWIFSDEVSRIWSMDYETMSMFPEREGTTVVRPGRLVSTIQKYTNPVYWMGVGRAAGMFASSVEKVPVIGRQAIKLAGAIQRAERIITYPIAKPMEKAYMTWVHGVVRRAFHKWAGEPAAEKLNKLFAQYLQQRYGGIKGIKSLEDWLALYVAKWYGPLHIAKVDLRMMFTKRGTEWVATETATAAAQQAEQQVMKHIPLLTAGHVASQSAGEGTKQGVERIMAQIIQGQIPRTAITAELLRSWIPGLTMEKTEELTQALGIMGLTEGEINEMSAEAAWARLLQEVAVDPVAETVSQASAKDLPKVDTTTISDEEARRLVDQAEKLALVIPSQEEIIRELLRPNWQKSVMQKLAEMPFGERAVRMIDPKLLFNAETKIAEEVIAINALARLEVIRMGTSIRAVKIGELQSILTNPVKYFGFDAKTAYSARMARRIKPENKGEEGVGNFEHVFAFPEKYKMDTKMLNYVTRFHETQEWVLTLLKQEGVPPANVIEDYIHRVALGKYKEGEFIAITGRIGRTGRLSSKKTYEKARKVPKMWEGISWGIQYDIQPDIILGTLIEEALAKVADERFISSLDKALEAIGKSGKTPTEVLLERNPEIVLNADVSAKALQDAKKLHGLLNHVIRGEVPTEQQLRAIDRRFPEYGKRLRALSTKTVDDRESLVQVLKDNQRVIDNLQKNLVKLKELRIAEKGKVTEVRRKAVEDYIKEIEKARQEAVGIIPDDAKLREAFRVMSWDERMVMRQALDTQLTEIEQSLTENGQQIFALREYFESDPVASFQKTITYKNRLGKTIHRKMKLTDVLVNGEFPESVTPKQAAFLLEKELSSIVHIERFGKYKGRVKREFVLDNLQDKFHMETEDDVAVAIENVYRAGQELEDLQYLAVLSKDRSSAIKHLTEIMDDIDKTPQSALPIEPEPIVQPEVAVPAKAVPEVKEQWQKTKGEIIQEIHPPTTERALIIAHRKQVENALREGKPVPAEVLADYPDLAPPALPRPVPGMPEAGVQKDLFGFEHPFMPKGKGEVTQMGMDDYNKLVAHYKKEGISLDKLNAYVKPKIEGVEGMEEETQVVIVKHEIPEAPDPKARRAELKNLRDEVKALIDNRKVSFWRTRYQRARAIEAIRESPGIGKGMIHASRFGGKIYDRDVIDAINGWFGQPKGSKTLRYIADTSAILRITKASLDVSFFAIQGLPALGLAMSYMATNPTVGVKMMGTCLKALMVPVSAYFSPEWMQRFLSKYKDEALRRIAFGGSSQAIDYFEILTAQRGLGAAFAKGIGKIPGRPYSRAELAFYGAGEIIRNEYWEIMKPIYEPGGHQAEQAKFLDRLSGVINTEAMALGLTHRQLESAWVWFAPRYTRACMTILSYFFRGGYTGAQAKRALGGMIMAGVIMFSSAQYAKSKLEGKSDKEAWQDVYEGFGISQDPITGAWEWRPTYKFMSIQVGNYNMGLGSFWYGLVRLSGNVMATINEVGDRDRIDLARIVKDGSFNRRDNPFLNWWFTRSAPMTGFMAEVGGAMLYMAGSGEFQAGQDFFGNPIETPADYARYFISLFEPIWLEQGVNPLIPHMAEDYEIPESTAVAATVIAGELFGMRTNPEYPWQRFYEHVNEEVLPTLDKELLGEFYTDEELAKVLEAQRDGNLRWHHLPDALKNRLRFMYPDLLELYEDAQAASTMRNSKEMALWDDRIQKEKGSAYEYGDIILDRVKSGELDTRELREKWGDRMMQYGTALDRLEIDYPGVYEYFDKMAERGDKYDWNLDQATNEYLAVITRDYQKPNGDIDWDWRDRQLDIYIEKWGEETYQIVRQLFADKKLIEGLDPALIKLSNDKDALGRDYWRLPYKLIVDMELEDETEGNIPAEYLSLWKRYQAIEDEDEREAFVEAHPELARDWRAEWRAENPEGDARLAFWGYSGKIQTKEAYDFLQKWSQEYGVSLEQMGIGLPPPSLIDDYFGYLGIQREFRAVSADARLFRLENPQFQEWAMENWDWKEVEDHIEALRITVKYKEEDQAYDLIQHDDASKQRKLREKYLAGNLEYAEARRKRDAYGLGLDDFVTEYVDYYMLPDKGSWRERYRLENPDFNTALEDVTDMMPLEPDKIKPELYDQLYLDFEDLFTQYAEVEGTSTVREEFREKLIADNPEFALAWRKRNGLEQGVPEKYLSDYVGYYEVKDKPEGFKFTWYADDRFLMEHPDYYKDVWLGVLENQKRDFSRVPSEEFEDAYNYTYSNLPKGSPRADYRASHLWFDKEGVKLGYWKPIEDRGQVRDEETLMEKQARERGIAEKAIQEATAQAEELLE